MESSCYNPAVYQLRQDLLFAALRHGQVGSKGGRPAPKKPLEEITTFKPFNIREIKWEVWDIKEAKYEQYINLHQQRGMFRDNSGYGGAAAPMNAGMNMQQ